MIRKTISPVVLSPRHPGLDLAELASFEVTSERPDHPLEHALFSEGDGWQASEPGEQMIRVSFDSPRDISRISLVFDEPLDSRTQEFTLLWQSRPNAPWRELRRQQFNFSPPSTTRESEDYHVSLLAVAGIELRIKPALSGSGYASLTHFSMV